MNINLRELNAKRPAPFSNDEILIINEYDTYHSNVYEQVELTTKDVDVRDIVGSTIDANSGTWGGVLAHGTDRLNGSYKIDNCLEMLQDNPFFILGQKQSDITFVEIDGKFYQAGNGIHRVITAKFLAAFNPDAFVLPTLKSVKVVRFKKREPFYSDFHEIKSLLTDFHHLSLKLLSRNSEAHSRFSLSNTVLRGKGRGVTHFFCETQTQPLIHSLKHFHPVFSALSAKGRFLHHHPRIANVTHANPWVSLS